MTQHLIQRNILSLAKVYDEQDDFNSETVN